jgi:hypothetical protein
MATNSHLALVPTLIAEFPRFLNEFESQPPFSKPEQLESHRKTVELRKRRGSSTAAIADPEFVESLHRTLRAWGIGSRRSKLRPFPEFSAALQKAASAIAAFDGLRIDDLNLDVDQTIVELWRLIESLNIVENDAPIVSGTKTLHHVLPELVPPMDRAYTQAFFLWHNPQFQYGQAECFKKAFAAFVYVSRQVDPQQYVGRHPWHTSRTKVVDNAVVGCVETIVTTAQEAKKAE